MNDKNLRIAFLGPAPPFRGGISKFATTLAEHLEMGGHSVRLYNFISQYPSLLFPGSDQYDNSSTHIWSERVFTPYLPYTWHIAVKRIKRFEPDIVILSYWIPFMAPAFGWIYRKLIKGKHNSPKIFLLLHNVEFHEKWLFAHRLSRYIFEKADKLLLLSEQSHRDLLSGFPQIDPAKIIRAFHPIYTDYALSHTAETAPDEDNTILFFGFIKAYKGLDLLLRAMPEALQKIPRLKLLIAGDVYGDKSFWEKMIRDEGIADSCETQFRYIDESEIASFFQRSHLCVLPYRSATQSGIIATAFAFDLPVIATNVGGLKEYIIEGETGYLVDPDDPKAVATAIIRYFSENKEAAMRQNIRSFKDQFSWQKLCQLILETHE